MACSEMSELPEVDLVCIYLGGNDWFTLDGSQHKHSPFVTGFAAFLSSIRELRPLTPILVLTADGRSGTCLGSVEDQRRYSQTLKKLLTAAASDQEGIHVGHVDCAGAISVDDPSDWGLMGHWSVAGHQKWARGVIPIISALTGWEPIEAVPSWIGGGADSEGNYVELDSKAGTEVNAVEDPTFVDTEAADMGSKMDLMSQWHTIFETLTQQQIVDAELRADGKSGMSVDDLLQLRTAIRNLAAKLNSGFGVSRELSEVFGPDTEANVPRKCC